MREKPSFKSARGGGRGVKRALRADRVAGLVISLGGVGTILAVLAVCLFLAWTAWPLFQPSSLGNPRSGGTPWAGARPLAAGTDEGLSLGWVLLRGGTFRVFLLRGGKILEERPLLPGKNLVSAALTPGLSMGAGGFRDGTICLFRPEFRAVFPRESEIPEESKRMLRSAGPRRGIPFRKGVLQLTPGGRYRWTRFQVEVLARGRAGAGPVELVAPAAASEGAAAAAWAGGRVFLFRAMEKEDFLSGENRLALEAPRGLPPPAREGPPPSFIALSGTGRDLYLAWADGHLERFRIPPGAAPFRAEWGSLLPPGGTLKAFQFIAGGTTLAWGDGEGNLRAGFLVPREKAWKGGLLGGKRSGRARFVLAATKDFGQAGSALTALAPSPRNRVLAAGFADGRVKVVQVTTGALLAKTRISPGKVELLAASPKGDAFLAGGGKTAWLVPFDPACPQVDLSSLFLPVWYEGYPGPIHMWQTSSASDDAEPKFGMVPLIFGTLKATFYALLFGAPLAFLGALFTSEFLGRRIRDSVKTTVELMAGLPSVVLGFLGALVLAPWAGERLAGLLLLFFFLPFFPAAGGCIWRTLPPSKAGRLAPLKLLFIAATLVPAFPGAFAAGPVLERALFGGDLKGWLAWTPGGAERFRDPVGGLFLLCLPPALAAGVFLFRPAVSVVLDKIFRGTGRRYRTVLEAVGFPVWASLVPAAAFGAACLLAGTGLDPRGPWALFGADLAPMGTFVQRNAVIVGIVMGFAVIPMIYSIAEDALSAVPDHLRSASLAAGATPWQTARRIVVPAAASGLFSALMIGMGRAVGETMIVLMALGNTPVMEANAFNGARTLSATIAVELPEAVRGSAHYRTLFMAALVLFAMTFLVNTAAEVVRLRFRKKAVRL